MKKKFFILSVLLCCAIVAVAIPAKPGWQTITQSDGTTLKVKTVGNAFNNALLTADGLTVDRGRDGDFYYTSSLTGLTAMRAHEAGQRTAAEKAFIQAQRGALQMQFQPYRLPANKGKLNAVGSNASADVPAMGERHIPIILVEFQDKKFNNTRERIIEAMLTGDESVGQYFHDQSNGMYHPVFDVYGIYCLSQDREYYGGHNGTTKDKGIGWLVTEACQLAADDGVSFQPYDTNGDRFCDVVIVIFAGVGEAQAKVYHPEAIWPCNWTLDAAKYYNRGGHGAFSPNPGEPYVNHFAVFNELYGSNDNGRTIDGIGTFVHEFGHCLGLPDLYDTAGNDNYGMGNWDVMCLGCYCNDGYTPVGYSAYEKVFMGWVDFIKPVANTYYTLTPWNQSQWTNNKPNNEKIQLVTILPADNKLSQYSESGDTWPYGSKRALTDESTPATVLYMNSYGEVTGNAGYLGKPVTEMTINRDGTASFWYMKETHNYPLGDVNHSGSVTISDVTALINHLLNKHDLACCTICADVKEDKVINISDVSALIDLLLH